MVTGRQLVYVNLLSMVAGYLFSADILATMDKYSNDVAACVIEKAKRICREQAEEVSELL